MPVLLGSSDRQAGAVASSCCKVIRSSASIWYSRSLGRVPGMIGMLGEIGKEAAITPPATWPTRQFRRARARAEPISGRGSRSSPCATGRNADRPASRSRGRRTSWPSPLRHRSSRLSAYGNPRGRPWYPALGHHSLRLLRGRLIGYALGAVSAARGLLLLAHLVKRRPSAPGLLREAT